MSKPWKQTITMHILPNISRKKGNQTMIILSINRILHEKCFSWKTLSLNQISKSIVIIQLIKFMQFAFCAVQGYRNILKLSCKPHAFTLDNFFKKQRSGTRLPVSFSVWIWRRMLLLLYCINWPYFIIWLPGVICVLQLFVN